MYSEFAQVKFTCVFFKLSKFSKKTDSGIRYEFKGMVHPTFSILSDKQIYCRSTQVSNSRVLRTVIKNSKPTIRLAFYYLTFTKIKNAEKTKTREE